MDPAEETKGPAKKEEPEELVIQRWQFKAECEAESLRVLVKRVMKALRSHLYDKYEFIADGRENIKLAEEAL